MMNAREHQLSKLDLRVLELSHPILLKVQVSRRTGLSVVFSPEILDDDTFPSPNHRPYSVQHGLARVMMTTQH